MGGGQPAHTTQTTEVKLPEWVEKASQQNYKLAQRIASKPYLEYQGPTVADPSQMTQDAYRYMMANVGAQDPLYENAAALAGRAGTELDPIYNRGYGYLDRSASIGDDTYRQARGILSRGAYALDPIYNRAQGVFADVANPSWDPSRYLNPYTNEVESRAVANAQRELDRSMMNLQDRAQSAGAWGGSAAGIERGVLAAEGARSIGDLSAELRAQGYDKATADMLADQQLRMGAGAEMVGAAGQQGAGWRDTAAGMISGAGQQQAGLQGAASGLFGGAGQQASDWLQSASGMLETAAGRGQATTRDFGSMLTAGAQEQAQRQALIDADRAKFEEHKNYDIERLNLVLASLGMSPYGKTENVEKTSTSEKSGADFATIGLGLLQMLPMMFMSDRRDKTDIEELGVDEDSGLPMYAYRYKKDRKDTPKIVGPMAQDVEKRYPEAVGEIGGHKFIHGGILARKIAA